MFKHKILFGVRVCSRLVIAISLEVCRNTSLESFSQATLDIMTTNIVETKGNTKALEYMRLGTHNGNTQFANIGWTMIKFRAFEFGKHTNWLFIS